MNTNTLTIRQKLLLAACDLPPEPFHAHALVVRAWERWPETFSLLGCDQRHPNSNAVLAKLSGIDGLVGLGWLMPTEPMRYRVLRAGYKAAHALGHTSAKEHVDRLPLTDAFVVRPRRASSATPKHKPSQPRASLPAPATPPPDPADVALCAALAKSDALRKFLRGSPLTFTDACAFWGISPKHLDGASSRLDEVDTRLNRAVQAFPDDGPAPDVLPPLSTCYGLLNLHRLMRGRFSRELAPRPGAEVTRG